VPAPRTPHAVLGEVIRQLREERGLSQETLADLSDLHRNAVGFIERGERAPNWDTVVKLADALDITMAELATAYEKSAARGKRR
jgi:transcriptional regulator with XRE-family HTH domain